MEIYAVVHMFIHIIIRPSRWLVHVHPLHTEGSDRIIPSSPILLKESVIISVPLLRLHFNRDYGCSMPLIKH